MQAVWTILLLSQVDKRPIKTELVELVKENTDMYNITQAKPRQKPYFGATPKTQSFSYKLSATNEMWFLAWYGLPQIRCRFPCKSPGYAHVKNA